MTVKKISVNISGILNCLFGGNWHRFLEISRSESKHPNDYVYMNEDGQCAAVRIDYPSLSGVFTDGKKHKVEFDADLRTLPYSRFVTTHTIKEEGLL